MLKYITIGENVFIPSYNLLVGIGIALAMLFLQYDSNFRKKSEDEKYKIHLSLLLSIITGFAGAFFFDAYTQNISPGLSNLNKIGLTFFSGLITGIILLALFLKLFGFEVLQTLNELTPSFCIAHIFGRIGCFLAGCCYGSPTDSVFGVTFPHGNLAHRHYHEPIKVHPTQLYESFFVLVVFVFLYKRKPKNTFFIYLLSYSVFRFFLEFIRNDNRGSVLGQSTLTPSQSIAIFTVIAIIFLVAINSLLAKKNSRITH